MAGPAYVGTTGLLGLVSTSSAVSNLCRARTICCEGSWLLHGNTSGRELRTHSGKIRKFRKFEAPSNWNEALDILSKYWDSSKPLLVDKSPKYLFQLSSILRDLRSANKTVSFVYVVTSPCFRPLPSDWDATAWGIARDLQELREAGAHVLLVRAEEMLGDPYKVAQDLLDFLPELRSLDPTKSGVRRAPYVNRGDSRAQSMVHYARMKSPKQFAGRNVSISASRRGLMQALGYTNSWFQEATFVQESQA